MIAWTGLQADSTLMCCRLQTAREAQARMQALWGERPQTSRWMICWAWAPTQRPQQAQKALHHTQTPSR